MMQNADLCRVQRVIVSQPFCVLEFDSDAVFEPFTLNKWTWKGRAASKVDALCGSAWKRDPGSGVIGVEKGPLIPLV